MNLKKVFIVLALLLTAFCLALWSSSSAPLPQGKLSAFTEGAKIGFKDEEGKVILKPRFDDYRAQVALKYERLDPSKGKPAPEEYLRSLELFPDGLCLVKLLGKWGYIDARGKLRIKAVYDKAQPFHKGQALVSSYGIWSVIDPQGKILRQTAYEDVSEEWSEGFTSYRKNEKIGFLDGDLKEICDPFFSEVSAFSNGMARVASGEGAHKRWGFLGTDGKIAVERDYTGLRDLSETLAAAATEMNEAETPSKWGYLNAKGKFMIAPRFDQALDFSQGLAAVLVHADPLGQGGDWGFIDKSGQFVIPPKFKRVSAFSEGVAAFTLNPDLSFLGALWGLMDRKGRVVAAPKFGAMPDLSFKDGRALVQLGKEFVWIDPKGNQVGPPP